MPCYCAKIKTIERDIAKITDAKAALQTLKSNNGSLDSALSALADQMRQMATPDNIEECAACIKALNKSSEDTITGMINQCTSNISRLEDDQTRYEQLDLTYHASHAAPKK